MRIAQRRPSDDAALRDVAELAAAFAPSKERHLETTAQGRAFVEATRAAWPCAALDRLARGLGRAGRLSGRGRRRRAPAMASRSSRRCRLPACGRRQLDLRRRAAHPARPDRRPARAGRARAGRRRDRARALASPLDDIGSAAFRADLASMRHETQYTRLFRSCMMTKSPTAPARRHRRPGRLRQDRADGCAVQDAARPLRDRRHHQRHLHQVGRRISGALRRARARAHRRRRDRRLSAHRDPRGCLDQSRRGRRHARASFPISIWC